MKRILTASVLGLTLWATIKLAPPWAFFVFVLLAVVAASWECYRLLEIGGARPFVWFGVTACVAVLWAFFRPDFDVSAPLIAVALLAPLAAIWRRPGPAEMLQASVLTIFPVLFVGLALAHVVGLRGMPGETGEDLLILLLVCGTFADTAAYYVGRSVGRRPMAARLSPKKTWEGAAGGIVASVAGGLLAHFWFFQRLPVGHAVALGFLLGATGMLGDLTESMIKRAVGAKDSSGLLPGHGGLLDRADTYLFSGPFLYHYSLVFLEVGP